MSLRSDLDASWRSGVNGARAHFLPGIVLQLVALTLVLGFYNVRAIHGTLYRLLQLREEYGYSLSVATTAIFGGVLPFLFLRAGNRTLQAISRYSIGQGIGMTAFWAYKGFEVDLWYRIQAHVFGAGHDLSTVVVKVVMDQFVYCPILAVPVTTVVYQLIASHCDWRAVLSDVKAPSWYLRKALPILVSNIGVWVPAVAVIYCLPTPLQLPLQNIVLCFYMLVVAHQTQDTAIRTPDGTKASP
jgi:hypothetical protein